LCGATQRASAAIHVHVSSAHNGAVVAVTAAEIAVLGAGTKAGMIVAVGEEIAVRIAEETAAEIGAAGDSNAGRAAGTVVLTVDITAAGTRHSGVRN
jgi:hypothetical protein